MINPSISSLGAPWVSVDLVIDDFEFMNVPKCSPKGRVFDALDAIAHRSHRKWVNEVNKRQIFLRNALSSSWPLLLQLWLNMRKYSCILVQF